MIQDLIVRARHATDRISAAQLRRAIELRTQFLTAAAGHNGHEAFPVVPRPEVLTGDVHLADLPDGSPARIDRDRLNGLTIVLGAPGSGKSVMVGRLIETLRRAGIWILATDLKGDDQPAHALPVLEPREAAITTSPPPGLEAGVWFTKLLWLLESSSFIDYGALFIRREHERLTGISRSEISFAELAAALQIQVRTSRVFKEQGYLATAAAALDRMTTGDGGLFSSASMLPWSTRLAHPHALHLSRTTALAARLAVLATLHAYILSGPVRQRTGRALGGLAVLDDARALIRESSLRSTSGVEPFQHAFDTGQSAGLGVLVVAQNLAELPRDLLASADNMILCGPVEGSEVTRLRDRLELTSEQAAYLQHQEAFRALVHLRAGAWTHPFPVRLLPCAADPGALAQERMDAKADLLAGFSTTPWTPATAAAGTPPPSATNPVTKQGTTQGTMPNTAPPPALDPAAHRCLGTILAKPYLLQSEIGKRCGVAGREITATRDALEAAGLVAVHKLGRLVLWEPLEPAARRLGVTFAPLSGRGGHPHRWLCHRIAAWARACGADAFLEHDWHGRRLDVLIRHPNATRAAYEVVLSNSNLDDTLEKLAAFGADTSVVIVADRKAVDRVRRRCGGAGLFQAQLPAILTVQQIIQQTAARI